MSKITNETPGDIIVLANAICLSLALLCWCQSHMKVKVRVLK